MIDPAIFRAALAHTLESVDLPGYVTRHRGKVRDSFVTADAHRVIVTTDRVSAFDRVLGTLPLKGQVLSQLATWWFEHTRDVAPNHLLSSPDPNVMVCIECQPLPVEVVVRAYLTGVTSTSVWTAYARGERRFCGHALPDGLRKNDPLPTPIVTPSTKAAHGGHDVSLSADEIVARGDVAAEDMATVHTLALALFARGQARCASQGLILADTKYEFGRTPDGCVVVMDEIHTPDSSRFWRADSYGDRVAAGEEPESLDKEYLRRWLAAQGFTGDGPMPELPDDVRVEAAVRYARAYEHITAEAFVPNLRPAVPRILSALGLGALPPCAPGSTSH